LWQRTIKSNYPRLISTISNPQAVITTDASQIAWENDIPIVEQNIKINKKREIKKLSQSSNIIGKRQSILSSKFNNFQVELYRLNRSKQKLETEEGLSDNSTEIVKLDEETNLKLEKIIVIYLTLRHFLPLIKKSKYKLIFIKTDNTTENRE
jgi:hypothetical protein